MLTKKKGDHIENLGRYIASKRVLAYEAMGFLLVIFFIWIDEILDIPHLFLGAEATPINWRELIFESIGIAILGTVIIYFTNKLLQRILTGILTVCASCKRIRDANGCWHQIESYIHDKSKVDFSHSICPECEKKLYPEFMKNKE